MYLPIIFDSSLMLKNKKSKVMLAYSDLDKNYQAHFENTHLSLSD